MRRGGGPGNSFAITGGVTAVIMTAVNASGNDKAVPSTTFPVSVMYETAGMCSSVNPILFISIITEGIVYHTAPCATQHPGS